MFEDQFNADRGGEVKAGVGGGDAVLYQGAIEDRPLDQLGCPRTQRRLEFSLAGAEVIQHENRVATGDQSVGDV